MIKTTVYPYFLKFKYPFQIAHTRREGTQNVYVLFERNGFHGWGEAIFPPYVKESLETFQLFFKIYQINGCKISWIL